MNAFKSPLRYGIIGGGAVGGLYGGMLAHAGIDVHFLMHSDFEHVRQHGLRIDSVLGDFHVSRPNVYDRADGMPRCDVVIVALKTTRNDLLAGMLCHLVADQGVVLTLQNGLDVEADLVSSVPLGRVLGGCCFLCSNKVGPGHIHHLDYGRIVFGVYRRDPSQPIDENCPGDRRGRQIVADMRAARIDAHWTDHLAAARWRKLMWNIPFNGLSVVLDASTDQIIASPSAKQLARDLIVEVHAGAASCGISIDPDAMDQTLSHTESMVPYDSSMRLDYRHHRPMEIDAIFGNPLRAVANATGSPADAVMPKVAMLTQQLRYLDAKLPAGISSEPSPSSSDSR